jgi:hypothetical protein
MLSGMKTRSLANSALWLVMSAALSLAGGALYLAIIQVDPAGSLFRPELTIEIWAILLAGSATAWIARLLTVGKHPRPQLNWAIGLWVGSRLALLIAIAVLLIGWLVAVASGLTVQTYLLRAAVLLLVVSAFTSIAGGGVLNAIMAFRHWRVQTRE